MYVKKRDERVVKFSISKISTAIQKAFNATDMPYDEEIIKLLSLKAVADFRSRIVNDTVDIEDIQDSVEKTLELSGFTEAAKAYILYRKQHEKIRAVKSTVNEFKGIIDSYLNMEDWRVKENSTVVFSLGGFILHNSGALTANYWLEEIYDREIASAHRNGDIHIHDLGVLAPYCAGWSIEQLIKEGLNGVEGRVASAPARHLSTLVNQMVNFLGILQNEWAGAQAFSSFDTYLAPFVKIDSLNYKQVKQSVQSFLFGVNTPSRWGSQPPFTNITLDWVVPEDMKLRKSIVGGKETNFTYGECQREMDIVNRALLECYLEGDYNGRGFQYPIPTYNITENFNWENPNSRLLFEMTSKYGTPYFQNFINSEFKPGDVRSMCCRLQLDKRELKRRGGGLFGSDEYTGSIGVVTINLPRAAYTSVNEDDFFIHLDRLMDLAKRSLMIKREVIEKFSSQGFFPYTKRYLKDFNNHFLTIGLVGMNEASLNARWIRQGIAEKEGHAFALRVLDYMRGRLADYQEETGNLFNLEATPAESAAYRLAKSDKEKYPLIITSGDKVPYYTNSSHLPVDYTEDIFSALELQEPLQGKYTGGTVFHTFLGESIGDWEVTRDLVKRIAFNFKIPYYTISPTYSVCKIHGYLKGEHFKCPECGEECEVYSRITGYYRPVKAWNRGKREEFKNRVEYSIEGLALPDNEQPDGYAENNFYISIGEK